jgi:hypothetical protein
VIQAVPSSNDRSWAISSRVWYIPWPRTRPNLNIFPAECPRADNTVCHCWHWYNSCIPRHAICRLCCPIKKQRAKHYLSTTRFWRHNIYSASIRSPA